MAFVKVASVSDLKDGEGKAVEANGKPIALFKIEGKFYAIDNTCKHKGGPLGDGLIDNEIVTCPWHGWQYNIKTGENQVDSNIKMDKFNVKVEGEDVLVEV